MYCHASRVRLKNVPFSIFGTHYLLFFIAVLEWGGAKAKKQEFVGVPQANNQFSFKYSASSTTSFKWKILALHAV